jgi:hypothetical protein
MLKSKYWSPLRPQVGKEAFCETHNLGLQREMRADSLSDLISSSKEGRIFDFITAIYSEYSLKNFGGYFRGVQNSGKLRLRCLTMSPTTQDAFIPSPFDHIFGV